MGGFARSRLFQQLVTELQNTAVGPWDLTILALHTIILDSGFHCNEPLENKLPNGGVSMIVLPRSWRVSGDDDESTKFRLEYVLAEDVRRTKDCRAWDGFEGLTDDKHHETPDQGDETSADDTTLRDRSDIYTPRLILELTATPVSAPAPPGLPENRWNLTEPEIRGRQDSGHCSGSDPAKSLGSNVIVAPETISGGTQPYNDHPAALAASVTGYLADSTDKSAERCVVEFQVPEQLRVESDSSRPAACPIVAPQLIFLATQSVISVLAKCGVTAPTLMGRRCQSWRRRSEASLDETSGSDVHDPERPGHSSGSSKGGASRARDTTSTSSAVAPAASSIRISQRNDPQYSTRPGVLSRPQFEPIFGVTPPEIFPPLRTMEPRGFTPEGNLIGPTNPVFGLHRPPPLGGPRYDPPGPFGRLDLNPDHEPVPRFRPSGNTRNPLDTMFM